MTNKRPCYCGRLCYRSIIFLSGSFRRILLSKAFFTFGSADSAPVSPQQVLSQREVVLQPSRVQLVVTDRVDRSLVKPIGNNAFLLRYQHRLSRQDDLLVTRELTLGSKSRRFWSAVGLLEAHSDQDATLSSLTDKLRGRCGCRW